MIKDILESAYDDGADMVVKLYRVCQLYTELHQDQINTKCGATFKTLVVYSALMSDACGRDGKAVGLGGQVIRAKKLEDFAEKQTIIIYRMVPVSF